MMEVFLIIISIYPVLGIVIGLLSRIIGVDGSNSHKEWSMTLLIMGIWPLYVLYLIDLYKSLNGGNND